MQKYSVISQSDESTVVAEYVPTKNRPESFQSEADLEHELIRMLCEQGYERAQIHDSQSLVLNLRKQMEALNGLTFSDSEWKRLLDKYIANPNDGVAEKTAKVQEDHVFTLMMDDGSMRNITIFDKSNVHKNRLQVINQYAVSRSEGALHDNRYDVTILVNGLPMVHVELKRRGVPLKQAFDQIDRYSRESFSSATQLFEYVHIFVISNGTSTKYYSNTTRPKSVGGKKSNTFEFTSFWADARNKVIDDLVDFTRTFFAPHTVLNILSRYCVFTSDKALLVMRPYQIAATERILNRIEIATNSKLLGTVDAGGYVWHTTGSGKTLTSFKTAQLASRLSYVDKVLFVVDRKDLDYQTMKEYDRFQKGAADSNSSTVVLKRQLEDPKSKIIITTIQKLSNFVGRNKGHKVFSQHVVMIFDECHRSQFGDMRKAIVGSFKRYNIFGFTGTPIFGVNAGSSVRGMCATTAQTFGAQLHSYTIVDAIKDGNVLPFHVSYVRTMKTGDDIEDEQVYDIQREETYMAPERIELVTRYILENFNRMTYRGQKSYSFKKTANIAEVAADKRRKTEEVKVAQHVSGFNSILAVSSIRMARLYYEEFKRQQAECQREKLRIATIFSYAANEAAPEEGSLDDENSENPEGLDKPSREFLEEAIGDYNQMFGTSYDTSSDKFQNYYKDVSLHMKNKDIDILIVVGMFLTGFDATTLNTLWVDKNLYMHGLIQAFSRTNRILNSVKTFGNIVCFRNLQKRVDDAVALFGDKEAGGVIVLRPFLDYLKGYTDEKGKEHVGYECLVGQIKERYPLGEQIVGEQAQKDFIALFGSFLKMRNLLVAFDEFAANDFALDPMTERERQDYTSRYLDLREEWRRKSPKGESVDITDDVVFEIELVQSVDINIDYILMLVQKYHDGNCQDYEIIVNIRKAIDASPELRSKKKLIENFIARANEMDDVVAEWRRYVAEQKDKELTEIIESERLKADETRQYMERAFRQGTFRTLGTEIASLMPPISLFGGDGSRDEIKTRIIDRLAAFFEKYHSVYTPVEEETPVVSIGRDYKETDDGEMLSAAEPIY